MKKVWLTVLVLCAAQSAQGQDLSAEAFEKLTEGKVLESRREDGTLYGHELFLSGRETLWQPPDGACKRGKWQEVGEFICYFYEFNDPGDCMQFSLNGEEIIGIEKSGYRVIHRIVDPSVMQCNQDDLLSSTAPHQPLQPASFRR